MDLAVFLRHLVLCVVQSVLAKLKAVWLWYIESALAAVWVMTLSKEHWLIVAAELLDAVGRLLYECQGQMWGFN